MQKAFQVSIDEQLGAFRGLQEADADAAKAVHALNEQMVTLCREGSFRKVKELVESHGGKLMTYFVVRAFKAALMGCHLVLVDYLLQQGYPLNSVSVPYVLLEVIADLPGSSVSRDQIILSILQFLISKQWNLNMQASKTWVSALHMTVQYSLLESTKALVQAGADVNSVASGDVLPLVVAEKAIAAMVDKKALSGSAAGLEWDAEQDDRLTAANAIRDLLVVKGARSTWRRGGESAAPLGFSAASETSTGTSRGPTSSGGAVRFTGGGGPPPAPRPQTVRFAGGENTLIAFPPSPPAPAQPEAASERVSSGGGGIAVEVGSGGNAPNPSFRVEEDGAMIFSTGGDN